MKIEMEIVEKDLQDRVVIAEMRLEVEKRIENLSEFSKKNLRHQIKQLRLNIDWLENLWLRSQKDAAMSKLYEALNVDPRRIGEVDVDSGDDWSKLNGYSGVR